MQALRNLTAVLDAAWDNLPFCNLQHGRSLNLDDMDIVFQLDLIACRCLLWREYTVLIEQLNILWIGQGAERLGRGAQNRQSTADRFLHPGLRIVVSVVNDASMLVHGVADDVANLLVGVLHLFQTLCKGVERICQDGVEHYFRICQRLRRTNHAELKLVSGKGKR